MAAEQVVGILLAAGRGRRFDSSGKTNKLLAPLPSGIPVAVAAAQNLCASLNRVVAVVRPEADTLAAALRQTGCEVIVCEAADEGMGSVLAFAIAHCQDAKAWLVALADMPFIAPVTYTALIRALNECPLVAPEFKGQRGHPVGFARRFLPQLLALTGDQGARQLLAEAEPHLVPTNDGGIARDIDLPDDL
jgi:molybdenum cofactor cytidylyltransferase